MSENESPNRKPLPTVRKLRQTKLVFSRNTEDNTLKLDIDSKRGHSLTQMSSNKKMKTDKQPIDGQCLQCEPTTGTPDNESPKVDPRVEDIEEDVTEDRVDSCDEPITDDVITDNVVTSETNKLALEMEMYCMADAANNILVVKALKTIEELKEECNQMGLKLIIPPIVESSSDEVLKLKRTGRSQESYEVESIYDSKVDGNPESIYYLVKWKNYSDVSNTWEPAHNLGNCRQLLDEFRHIQTIVDKKERKRKMKVYRNYHKLKGIIEDVVERKIQNAVMITILLKFNDIALKDYNYTKIAVNKMRTNLKDRHLFRMNQISEIKDVDRRVEQMTERFNKFIKELNITKLFGSFEKFFEFFVNRKESELQLNRWQFEVNAIITKEKEGQHIRLENFVDCDEPPNKFDYISKCRTNNVDIIISDEPPIFCQCDNCETQPSNCCVAEYQSPFAYTKYGILDSRYRHAIYECNKRCNCPPNCINRVFQNGRKHKLAIFKTDDNKGWGVRALEPIQKGSYVMEYVGEIITVEEADKRGHIYDAEGRTYLFDLDYTTDAINKYTLDATQCGNVSHFVNHSCDPNLDTRVVWVNNLDPFMPHIALFAVRNIRVNEELTFDYKISVHGITDADRTETEDQSIEKSFDSGIDGSTIEQKFVRVPCRCGAPNCRKYLY